MGLDIFAASHIKYARPIPRRKEFDKLLEEIEAQGKSLTEVYFPFYTNASCHRQRLGGMKPGLYSYTKKSRKYEFRAGSYSGYNWWRNQLSLFALEVGAEAVWREPRIYRGKPFVELINFTDCDGRIGTSVCEKLAEDFTSHAARAKRFPSTMTSTDPDAWPGDDWLAVYRQFARAFRLAAQNGALAFC
ncbi:MAG: hypothetical protein L0241_24930 [Planctomycetia bacterium]|nr:hypothetical protein [Planctomycetia bacterium]